MSDLHRSPGDDHYSDEEWYRLTHDQPPTGSELVRVRTELVELCRLHAPASVREAEALLLWAELDLLSQASA